MTFTAPTDLVIAAENTTVTDISAIARQFKGRTLVGNCTAAAAPQTPRHCGQIAGLRSKAPQDESQAGQAAIRSASLSVSGPCSNSRSRGRS